MKRLLPYVILALAFHAIILSTDFSWLRLTPGLTPAAKSLSITLSADTSQKRKAQATVSNKVPQRQRDPSFTQKPSENPDAIPTPARVEHTAQLQKPLPATPPKNIVKKARLKKNMKALTFKKQRIKTIDARPATARTEPHVALKAETKIFTAASSDQKPVRKTLPADTTSIRKTQRVPDSSPTTTAAMLPGSQSDDTLSGSILKLARPLYKQNTSPPYPRKARRLGYEGIVMLKALIDENGRVDDLTVLQSSGHTILDRAASSAVRKWLFEPGTEGGIKKKMWVKIPVHFQLE